MITSDYRFLFPIVNAFIFPFLVTMLLVCKMFIMIIVFHRVSDICNSRFMLCQTYAWIQLFSSIINMPLKKNKMNEMKFMFTSQYGQSNAKFASKFRSNHLRWSIGKGILKKFAKCTEKHLCQSLFFNIVAG